MTVAANNKYSLRQYVVHAEKFGGYDSVYEEAVADLTPLELGRLALAMRGMHREYKPPGIRTSTVRETFKLTPDQRGVLIAALLGANRKVPEVADLAGCSTSHVRGVRDGLAEVPEDASQSLQTGDLNATTEDPGGVGHLARNRRQKGRTNRSRIPAYA